MAIYDRNPFRKFGLFIKVGFINNYLLSNRSGVASSNLFKLDNNLGSYALNIGFIIKKVYNLIGTENIKYKKFSLAEDIKSIYFIFYFEPKGYTSFIYNTSIIIFEVNNIYYYLKYDYDIINNNKIFELKSSNKWADIFNHDIFVKYLRS